MVAWQLSRRMTRPLIEAMEVTGQIAAGDLESRVPIREGDYTEFSSLGRSINAMAQSLADGRGPTRRYEGVSIEVGTNPTDLAA